MIVEQRKRIAELEGTVKYVHPDETAPSNRVSDAGIGAIRNLEFDIDEQRVFTVKFQKKSDDLDKALKCVNMFYAGKASGRTNI